MRRVLRVCISRLGVTVLLIFAELIIFLTLIFGLSSYSLYSFVFLLVLNVISLFVVVNGEENPEYKLTWLSVILLLPPLGTVLFALFGRVSMRRRDRRRLAEIRAGVAESLCGDAFARLGEISPRAAGRAMAITHIDETSEVYSHTESEYFSEGYKMWERMLSDLGAAKRYIFLEYFLIERGAMWDSILEVLVERAALGVDVRVIYDDIGSIGTLERKYPEKLKARGIKCIRFAPVSAGIGNMRRNNNRDHRKICVIDGEVAYTGGINIADEYIGQKLRFGVWKDGGVRVFGDAAEGFLRLFLELWALGSGESEDICPYLSKKEKRTEGDGGFYLPFGSGPYPMYRCQSGKRAILDMINQAQRYVYIMTPYLIIDFDLTEALRGAAFRGVDVRIITPGIDDKPPVGIMTRGSFPHLISGGVGIYEYTPGFMHMKSFISDDRYALIGTLNLDYRSLVHHFEDALWIYGSPAVISAREDFLDTLSHSRRVEKTEDGLGLFGWCIHFIIRLFAPLL